MQRAALLLTICVLAGFPTIARAQYQSDGLQTSASSLIERPAGRMRVEIDLLAKSTKGLPDALAKLKAQRAKVEKALEKLGAIKDAVDFGEAKIDRSQEALQQQLAQMYSNMPYAGAAYAAPAYAAPAAAAAPPGVAVPTAPSVAAPAEAFDNDSPQPVPPEPPRGRRRPSKQAAPAKPVFVKMALVAEWPLKEGDAEARMVQIEKLQEAIKAADLAGLKATQEMTPEEAELAEEMAGMAPPSMHYGGQSERKPGEPKFTFSAQISVADYEKALAEAFRDAKKEAIQTAKAAEIQLGPLKSLNTSASVISGESSNNSDRYSSPFDNSSYPVNHKDFKEDKVTITGANPEHLYCSVHVWTTYSIKEVVRFNEK